MKGNTEKPKGSGNNNHTSVSDTYGLSVVCIHHTSHTRNQTDNSYDALSKT